MLLTTSVFPISFFNVVMNFGKCQSSSFLKLPSLCCIWNLSFWVVDENSSNGKGHCLHSVVCTEQTAIHRLTFLFQASKTGIGFCIPLCSTTSIKLSLHRLHFKFYGSAFFGKSLLKTQKWCFCITAILHCQDHPSPPFVPQSAKENLPGVSRLFKYCSLCCYFIKKNDNNNANNTEGTL